MPTGGPGGSETGEDGELTGATRVDMNNETQPYSSLMLPHLGMFIDRLRRVSSDKWRYQVTPAAPSPRQLAEHAWQWLVCDRQYITEPDVAKHTPPASPPDNQQAMCNLLEEEMAFWRKLLSSLAPEHLDDDREYLGDSCVTVRDLICHMVQNVIYKHGELATIYFALGLDGTEPYTAPLPNTGHKEAIERKMKGREAAIS